MSTNLYMKIEILDTKTGNYRPIELYTMAGEKVFIWPWNASHELFDILRDHNPRVDIPAHWGVPVNFSGDQTFFNTQPRWCTLADLELARIRCPTIPDYDSEDEDRTVPNPLFKLIDTIKMFLQFADEYVVCFSDVRITYELG